MAEDMGLRLFGLWLFGNVCIYAYWGLMRIMPQIIVLLKHLIFYLGHVATVLIFLLGWTVTLGAPLLVLYGLYWFYHRVNWKAGQWIVDGAKFIATAVLDATFEAIDRWANATNDTADTLRSNAELPPTYDDLLRRSVHMSPGDAGYMLMHTPYRDSRPSMPSPAPVQPTPAPTVRPAVTIRPGARRFASTALRPATPHPNRNSPVLDRDLDSPHMHTIRGGHWPSTNLPRDISVRDFAYREPEEPTGLGLRRNHAPHPIPGRIPRRRFDEDLTKFHPQSGTWIVPDEPGFDDRKEYFYLDAMDRPLLDRDFRPVKGRLAL